MTEAEIPGQQEFTSAVRDHGRVRRDGPFWFALVLVAVGSGVVLLASVTILPWIDDERTSQSIRSIWLALSRNLPDVGPDAVVRIGFWVIVVVIGLLSVGLMVLASAVRDDADPSA
jgi:hypothetical protein